MRLAARASALAARWRYRSGLFAAVSAVFGTTTRPTSLSETHIRARPDFVSLSRFALFCQEMARLQYVACRRARPPQMPLEPKLNRPRWREPRQLVPSHI